MTLVDDRNRRYLTEKHSIVAQDNDFTNFSSHTFNGVENRKRERDEREMRLINQTRLHSSEAFRRSATAVDTDSINVLTQVLVAIRNQVLGVQPTAAQAQVDADAASGSHARATGAAPSSITETFRNSTAGRSFGAMFGGFVPSGVGEFLDRSARGIVRAASGAAGQLLDLIGSKESHGNYDTIYTGAARHFDRYSDRHFGGRDLTDLTVREVMQWQRAARADGMKSTAAGKYQIISDTFTGLVRQMRIDPNAKFDEALQDRMGHQLLENRGLNRFLSGNMSLERFQNNIAAEWASMPLASRDPNSRVGRYDGDGLNAGGLASGVMRKALQTLDLTM